MQRATLGGVPGAGEVTSRRRTETLSDYRGTFAFHSQHESAMVQLFNARGPVEFDGVVDGERRKLKVFLTDLTAKSGMVHFEGSGAPY